MAFLRLGYVLVADWLIHLLFLLRAYAFDEDWMPINVMRASRHRCLAVYPVSERASERGAIVCCPHSVNERVWEEFLHKRLDACAAASSVTWQGRTPRRSGCMQHFENGIRTARGTMDCRCVSLIYAAVPSSHPLVQFQ